MPENANLFDCHEVKNCIEKIKEQITRSLTFVVIIEYNLSTLKVILNHVDNFFFLFFKLEVKGWEKMEGKEGWQVYTYNLQTK